MKRSVAFTFPIVLLIACISATLITGCDSSGEPTPTVTPTPTETVTPTVIPTPGTPTPTDTPTPSPEIPYEILRSLGILHYTNPVLVDYINDSGFLDNLTEEKKS